jgi:hypothetical protein
MKRPITIAGIIVATALLGGILILATAGSGGAATEGLLSDHALIDQSGTTPTSSVGARTDGRSPSTARSARSAAT